MDHDGLRDASERFVGVGEAPERGTSDFIVIFVFAAVTGAKVLADELQQLLRELHHGGWSGDGVYWRKSSSIFR